MKQTHSYDVNTENFKKQYSCNKIYTISIREREESEQIKDISSLGWRKTFCGGKEIERERGRANERKEEKKE